MIHKQIANQFFAYGPYVKEMNLWLKYVDEVIIVAPCVQNSPPDPIDLPYIHQNIQIKVVPEFNLLSWGERFQTLVAIPSIFLTTVNQMRNADHIHLRCPGNMGLIGCLAQVLFPKKNKSAKYAGNWDPKSNQPKTYQLQQKILANEFLTRNMKVLVYGDWEPNNKNLLSFFTASYKETEKTNVKVKSLDDQIRLIFVGSLHSGKNPLISCKVIQILVEAGINCQLDLYGEGEERRVLEEFVSENGLFHFITLHGNVNAEILKSAFAKSHFLVFASESEGWPKAVAEAMFWGCLPVTTPVSCVPQMLGNGSRGDLVEKDPRVIAARIIHYLSNELEYQRKAKEAMTWSRQFTLEKFEEEIKKILIN